jgi:hypothetical protein
MGYLLINNAKFKKNIAVGVTFMEEGKRDADVISRLNKYKKQIKMLTLLFLLAIIPGIFISKFWILLTYWLVWTDLVIFLYAIPFYLCNRDLKKLKREKGWVYNATGSISVDTATIPGFKQLSSLLFIIPSILSLLPLIWDRTFYMLYIVSGLTIIIFWFIYRYLYRNRSETVNEEKDLTRVLTQIRHYNWSKIWLIASWLTAILSYSGLLFINNQVLALVLVFVLSTVICVEAVGIEIKIRKMQEKLTKGSGTGVIVDEDDKWIGGMIYYNPNDSKLIVNERVGMNTTMNLARTSGKVIMGFILIFTLAMPFIGPALHIYYEQPIKIQVSKEEIIATQGITKYHIKISDIENIELINELPNDLVRVNGSAYDNFLKGNFRSGKENMILLVRPDNKPFIRIKEKGGKVFVLGFEGDVEGKFEEMKEIVK